MTDEVVWVATYERVSSDDQRDRETIETQREVIDRFLAQHPAWRVYRRYRDNGVSGTIPLRLRPDGKALVADASQGRFVKLIVTRSSRLGRDEIDLLQTYGFLQQLAIELIGVSEPVGDQTMFGFSAILNGASRRQFLAQTKEGLERAARESRYCGGIVPYGYAVEGKRPNSRLVPSTTLAVGELSEADVVRRMYERIALEGWSCRRVAEELNALGVPPVYARDGRLVTEPRGVRKRKTKGVWTAQRVRNTVTQPTYKGLFSYGRRSEHGREVITAPGPALVSEELWDAAQAALLKNRLMAKNTDRVDLLSGGVLRCAHCGRRYSASWTPRDGTRYRCNGAVAYKQAGNEQCQARSFRGSDLEPLIWEDIERWLRDPGDVLGELLPEVNGEPAQAVHEAELATLRAALEAKRTERDRLLDLYQAGDINIPELKERIADVADKLAGLERRIAELEEQAPEPAPFDTDLLEELRRRLDAGLDDRQRKEIVRLLADVVLHTEHVDGKRKRLKAVVTYRFPGVANACTGRGSSRRRA